MTVNKFKLRRSFVMTVQESKETGFQIKNFFSFLNKSSSSKSDKEIEKQEGQMTVEMKVNAELQERIQNAAKTLSDVEVSDLPKTAGKLSLVMRQAENTIAALKQQNVGEDSQKLLGSIQAFCRQTVDTVGDLTECQKILDSTLFITRNDLAAAYKAVNSENPAKAVEEKALEMMNILKSELEELRDQQDEYHLQSGAATYANELSLSISSIMDTDQGLAIGLSSLVADVFIPKNEAWVYGDTRPSYLAYLELQLNKLVDYSNKSAEDFKNLQTQYLMVQKPTCKMANVDLLIRATLVLGRNDEITNADARVSALGDYFRQPRQQETGTCFEERQQIWTQMNRPDIGFTDDKNIFAVGGMVRSIDGKPQIFRFSDQIADYELENYNHLITNHGSLVNQSGEEKCLHVWDAPGVQSALKVVGIVGSDELYMQAMAKIFGGSSDEFANVNVVQVLSALVNTWKELNPSDKRSNKELLYSCYFAFSAQTHFPLQRVKMDMIAQMTQSHTGGFLNQAVDSCVANALNELATTFAKTHAEPSQANWQAAAYLANMFVRTFSEMRSWTYENLGNVEDRKDGEANHGQWVLRGNDGTARGERMDNPEVFQAFLTRVADTTWKNTNVVELPKVIADIAKGVFDQMKEQINSPVFVKSCFQLYNPANNVMEDPLANWKELDHTPIRDKSGGMTAAVVDDYFGVSLPIMTQFKPESAEDALTQVSAFYREQMSNDKGAFDAAWPMDIPGHAVNLWPDKRMGKNQVVENLKRAGQRVANQQMPPNMADAVRSVCFKFIADKAQRQAARTQFKSALTGRETIGSWCKKLLDSILEQVEEDGKAEVRTKVCDTVLSNLPRSERAGDNLFMQITTSAVRVFDLDWGGKEYVGATGTNEVHAIFGKFYYDPTLGEIQLAGVGDDKSYIYSIQDEFLGNPGKDTWGAFAGSKELLELPNPAVIRV
jgi:hypothetical protein